MFQAPIDCSMDAVNSWADQLIGLCDAYSGVKSDAFFAMVESGSRLPKFVIMVSFRVSTSAPGRWRPPAREAGGHAGKRT